MSDELLKLADAVECYKVEGPWDIARDRERDLNERIAIAAGVPCTVRVGHPALGDERTIPARIPAYTASLDAAMTLVPEGRFVGALNQCDTDGEWYARIEAHDAVYEDATATTAALALTTASLRARASHLRMEVE